MGFTRACFALLLFAAMGGACGARTFRQAPEGSDPAQGGFEAREEEQAPEALEEAVVDDDSVSFDPDAGPFEEIE